MSGAKHAERAVTARRFKPYPAYKDSGVEWLGEIPVAWKVSRADAFLRYEKLQVEPSEISDELVFHYSIPSVQDTGDGALEPPSEIDSAKLRIVGDRLLVSKLNPRKGVVLIATEKDVPTLCSTEFVPFEVRGCDLRWAMYLFLAESTRQRLSAVVRSATRSHQRAEISEIVKIWHGVPDIPEQRAIAAFLDWETARIDGLVAKKERLIELLQEQRTALITRAVTKGLDPNVPMKDSGVEWLGAIPAHWEVKRLWHLTPSNRRIMYGIVLPGPNVDDGVPIVKGGDVSSDRLRLDRLNRTTREIESGYARSRLQGGDLVYAIRGSIGEVAIVPDEIEGANLTQDAARIAYTAATHGPWLLHALKSTAVFAQLEAGALGATIRGINIRDLKRATIVVPPLAEQRAIAAFLDRETARIDTLVAKVRDAVEHLKELRTALISAAVTGKIDVWEEVA